MPDTNDSAQKHATGDSAEKQSAGLFDIRNIIGGLLLVYGVVLTLMGLFATSSAEEAKSAGVNANLWTGIGLLVIGGLFVAWALLRPIVVDERDVEDSEEMRKLQGL